jgi:hypothetical protein
LRHDLGKTAPRAYDWFYFDLTEGADGTQMSVSMLSSNPFDLTPYMDSPQGSRCPDCAPPNQPAPGRHAGVAVHIAIPGAPPRSLSVQQLVSDGDARMAFQADPWKLRIVAASVTRAAAASPALPDYCLQFDVDDGRGSHAVGNLIFHPVQPEWMVPDALLFEQQTDIGHWHRWAVHVPRATVSGECSSTTAPAAFSMQTWVSCLCTPMPM